MTGGDDVVRLERDGQVARVVMNRPKVLNVLDGALADALVARMREVAGDAGIRAVILAGEGRSFMAGGDLAALRSDLSAAPRLAENLIDRFQEVLELIGTMPKPVVAAVQGPVAGGGVGLALACDLVVMAEEATLQSAYARIAQSPDDGTTWLLPRLLGPRRALDFMLLGERIGAAEALRLGLVNRVCAASRLDAETRALAERLVANAPGSTANIKALVRASLDSGHDAQLAREKRCFATAAGTADFAEGLAAFFERREPKFGA